MSEDGPVGAVIAPGNHWCREDVQWHTRDGTCLRGWLYRPETCRADDATPKPAIVMSHGFTAIIDQDLPPFAEAMAAAGFVVLCYDHRGYGRSDGSPRQETDPFQQMHDMRDAITYVSVLPGIDESRIGLWGTSYSGGHVLVVAAVDRRVACVVAVVPLISGSETVKRLAGEGNLAARRQRQIAVRKQEMAEGGVQYQQHAADNSESLAWFQAANTTGQWLNSVSVISQDMVGEYEPGDYIHRIGPTPLLMIVADNDLRCPTDLQLAAYERAREPKQLLIYKGGHYDSYTSQQAFVAERSTTWLARHLIDRGEEFAAEASV